MKILLFGKTAKSAGLQRSLAPLGELIALDADAGNCAAISPILRIDSDDPRRSAGRDRQCRRPYGGGQGEHEPELFRTINALHPQRWRRKPNVERLADPITPRLCV